MRLRRAARALGMIATLALGAAPAASAQAPKPPSRVAMVCAVACEGPTTEVLRRALGDLGRVDGRNLALALHGADGQNDRLPAILREMLAARPDVIVAVGPQPVRAARDATSTVPIVMMFVADPVLIGLVPSLTRPGGNITGVTTLPGPGFIAKQMELLKELVPGATRLAAFWNSTNEIHRANLHRELPPAAEQLGLRLQLIDVRTPADIEPGVAAAVREGAHALLVVGDPIFHRPAARLPDLALRAKLPAVYIDREVVAAGGGLMSYGPDWHALARRAAVQIDRIIAGAKPADIPIEQPTTFVLAINQRAARALGLTVPPSLLVRATEVVE